MDEGSPLRLRSEQVVCSSARPFSAAQKPLCHCSIAQLRSATDDATELTRAFTGRPARALRNRFVADMADAEVLGFPLQASVVAPLWQAADETARAQLTPFWAGQAAALTREAPAAELVEKLVAEAQAALSRSR